jgi:hypothetical protein
MFVKFLFGENKNHISSQRVDALYSSYLVVGEISGHEIYDKSKREDVRWFVDLTRSMSFCTLPHTVSKLSSNNCRVIQDVVSIIYVGDLDLVNRNAVCLVPIYHNFV